MKSLNFDENMKLIYRDIINEFKENNKDLKVGAIYKQDNVVQCNVYSANNLFIDMLEITIQ